ncbi:MAG: hypothetical protein GY696_00810 [Gammaproteobacteria bacterium]|nr:hypothetical protein [Gammaproteobacteria bacterium]
MSGGVPGLFVWPLLLNGIEHLATNQLAQQKNAKMITCRRIGGRSLQPPAAKGFFDVLYNKRSLKTSLKFIFEASDTLEACQKTKLSTQSKCVGITVYTHFEKQEIKARVERA